MRVLLSITLLLAVASSAFAQSDTGTIAGTKGCWPVTSRDQVVVHLNDGPARKGTLLCMGPEEIMLTGGGSLPLSKIQKIEKPRDGVLDGMLKGAAVGLLIFAQ